MKTKVYLNAPGIVETFEFELNLTPGKTDKKLRELAELHGFPFYDVAFFVPNFPEKGRWLAKSKFFNTIHAGG